MQRKWYRSVLEKDIDAVNGTPMVPASYEIYRAHSIAIPQA